MSKIKISSNWSCENESRLKNLVTFIQNDNKKCDFEHITPETCICLKKGENSDSKPDLIIKLDNLIKEMIVFSEATLIEVFGVHDEYLFTCYPKFVDEWEGMGVYHASFALPLIQTCRLKFTRLKEKDRLWLYSIQLKTTKSDQHCDGSLFNFENVNKLISTSGLEISEKAEKFKKLFEFCAKNSGNFEMQTLLKVINSEYNVQFPGSKSFSKILSGADCLNTRKETSGSKLECLDFKGYIDVKLMELKEDLIKCVEYKINELKNETNDRLDHIIKLLERPKV